MDVWLGFDALRSDWERQRDHARARHVADLEDLQAHATAFLMVSAAVWLLCATAAAPLLWPALMTGVWACILALHVQRFMERAAARTRRRSGGLTVAATRDRRTR